MSAGLLKMARPRDVVCVEERRKRWYPIKRVARKNRERGWRGGAIMEAIVIKDEGESLIIFLLGRERIFQGSLELGTRTPYVGYRPLLLTNFGDNFSFSPLVFAIICPQCSIWLHLTSCCFVLTRISAAAVILACLSPFVWQDKITDFECGRKSNHWYSSTVFYCVCSGLIAEHCRRLTPTEKKSHLLYFDIIRFAVSSASDQYVFTRKLLVTDASDLKATIEYFVRY